MKRLVRLWIISAFRGPSQRCKVGWENVRTALDINLNFIYSMKKKGENYDWKNCGKNAIKLKVNAIFYIYYFIYANNNMFIFIIGSGRKEWDKHLWKTWRVWESDLVAGSPIFGWIFSAVVGSIPFNGLISMSFGSKRMCVYHNFMHIQQFHEKIMTNFYSLVFFSSFMYDWLHLNPLLLCISVDIIWMRGIIHKKYT